jgi:hypothetical protein
MNHLFALIAMSMFQRRKKPAVEPAGHRRRERVRLLLWKACVLGICGSIGALPNTVHADRAVAPAQIANRACQTTMGLNPSEAEYAACIVSLNLSLAAAYEADDVSRNPIERACAEMGIRLRSYTFNKCVVDLTSTLLKLQSIPGR